MDDEEYDPYSMVHRTPPPGYGFVHRILPAVHIHSGGPIDTLFLGPRDVAGDSHIDYVAEAKANKVKAEQDLRESIYKAVWDAVRAEREECAKLADSMVNKHDPDTTFGWKIAEAIRERSK